jgi:hypothetical protein
MASYPQTNMGLVATISGKSPLGEIILGTLIILITVTLFFTAEGLYTASKAMSGRFQRLMDYTANADDKALVIHQNASKYSDAKPVLPSNNEPSGAEFAYSFYLYVNSTTFNTGSDVLYHVWHKGYGCVWPLMGPGVFIKGSSNTMRIVMNTYENPYAFVDVANIPIRKWFHVVLNCRQGSNGGLEVHINGNLTNKLRFDNTLPYLNYEDIILFSGANFTLNPTTPALKGNPLQVSGAFKGLLSEFIYTRYALSFTEIQSLYNAGPSKQIKTTTQELPPYLADSWWTSSYRS